jgi:phosphatidyl-myo-inositol dimannoside synthase
MRLLFVTRTYPPLVGGMEKFASDFYTKYKEVGEIDLLANRGGKKALPGFFVKALLTIIVRSRKYDVIHLYDAVLSPLILLTRLVSDAKITTTVNGLDIVYSGFGYQKLVAFCLKRAHRIIAISEYTAAQCVERGIPREKLTTIPVGIDPDTLDTCPESRKREIAAAVGVPMEGKRILLTIGRLVRRKGHAWFVASIMPRLPAEYIYLIAGAGPEEGAISVLVRELGLAARVFMLDRVSDEMKNCLYQLSDLFIMPNITVAHDQEGFGIVLLEAGCYGVPVIASNVEGIRDAVLNGATGWLIDERDVAGFLGAILNPNLDLASIRDKVVSNFDWRGIAERYLGEFEKLLTQAEETHK